MSIIPPAMVRKIAKHGSSMHVTIPTSVMHRLGWNQHDVLVLTVVERSLVLTRVDLPKVGELRGANTTQAK